MTVVDALKEEIVWMFHYDIVSKVKTFKIPTSLVISLNEITSKIVPRSKSTQAVIGSETAPVAGSTDKRMIIWYYLKSDFLPMQIIFGGKARKSILRMSFPSSFCICANEKHYSSVAKPLKLFNEVIIPMYRTKRNPVKPESSTDNPWQQLD